MPVAGYGFKATPVTAAEISANTVTKLGKNETVSIEVLLKICKVFHCDIGDIMEVIETD